MRSSPMCFLLLTAVLLSACSDATAPGPSGSMSFTYHGSVPGSSGGAFSVEGPRSPFLADIKVTGAVAHRYAIENVPRFEVIGASAVQSQLFSITIYGVPGIGMLPQCETATIDCVHSGRFWSSYNSRYFHGSVGVQPPYPEVTVTITEITESRVRGTFEGMVIGHCYTCPDPLLSDTVTISGGQFDVPFRP